MNCTQCLYGHVVHDYATGKVGLWLVCNFWQLLDSAFVWLRIMEIKEGVIGQGG